MERLNLTGGQAEAWRLLADGEMPEAGERVVVPLDRFKADADVLFQQTPSVGVRLTSAQRPEDITDALDRVTLIELQFLAFKDGRPFTLARRLRDQLGYAGEIRAVGDFLPDQALFLCRCGFDSVEVNTRVAADAVRNAIRQFSVWYQPASDQRLNVMQLRHPLAGRRQAS